MLAGCDKKKEKNLDLNRAACMLQPLWKRSSLHLASSLGPLIISGEGEAWGGGGGAGEGGPGGRPGEGEAWGGGGLGRGRPGEGEAWGGAIMFDLDPLELGTWQWL